ncbi:MAG: HPr kinase/phosphatase C-terminal domain-containing protein [Pseudolabrys sp.]|nr:HPr kinase/phosphatase C-terminal domain-containing protein [Pseudolabrys sp.]MBV9956229.1 HPr kinase/phosphatase C-terminal domain-containing protein [Pseudolabrys sp.]
MAGKATVHASAVLVGAKAVLIRGPSGAGKSRLAFDLILAAETGALPFARLVADDRAMLEAHQTLLLVRPPPNLAGLLEVRGLGIRRLPYEPVAAVGLVVEVGGKGERMPEAGPVTLEGISLPQLTIPRHSDPLAFLLAALRTSGI